DLGRALSIAGEMAKFAGDRRDYKTALQWVRYARDLAQKRLKPDDPARTLIDFTVAEFETQDATQAGDRDRAYAAGKRAFGLVGSFPRGHPRRERILTIFAEIQMWRGEDEAAS